MKREGVSYVEVLVVCIIVGVLATLFIPSMQDPLERSRAKNAEYNLMAIYSAEKRYLLSERSYYLSNASIPLQNRTREINANLAAKISDRYFDYDIITDGAGGYRARAVRKDGKCKNKEMNLTSDNSTVNKTGCAAW